jgi:putative sterol carrier protein
MSPTKKSVLDLCPAGSKPDVSVTISSSDLANVLDGSLAPLQAYLTGRIQASGDVRKLMLFDKLSRRGHKSGSMFAV